MDILSALPIEVAQDIFGRIPARDLCSCSAVSKQWRSLVNSDTLWKPICDRDNCNLDVYSRYTRKFSTDFEVESETTDLEPLCLWRRVYNWYMKQTVKWTTQDFTRYKIVSSTAPVYCIDCDGATLVTGHEDGTIAVWDVTAVPKLEHRIKCAVPEVPVLNVMTNSKIIIAVQKRLLEVYAFHGTYRLVNAKSFDLNDDQLELRDTKHALGKDFASWFRESLTFSEAYAPRKLSILLSSGDLYIASCRSPTLLVWTLPEGNHKAMNCARGDIKDIFELKGSVYIVSQRVDTYVASVKGRWLEEEFHVLGSKKMTLSEGYFIGLPNSSDAYLRKIWVWDSSHGWACSSRTIQSGHTSAAATSFGVVIYSENDTINVWETRKDVLLLIFRISGTVGFMRPAFTKFLLVFTLGKLHLCDWAEGKLLYTIQSNLTWTGDYRDLIWLDHTTVIAGGFDNQLEMITYL